MSANGLIAVVLVGAAVLAGVLARQEHRPVAQRAVLATVVCCGLAAAALLAAGVVRVG